MNHLVTKFINISPDPFLYNGSSCRNIFEELAYVRSPGMFLQMNAIPMKGGHTMAQSNEQYDHQGLYDPTMERDSCGLGLVVSIQGEASHGIVTRALGVLRRLSHRGGIGADGSTGDGAGIMLQIPHNFLREEMEQHGVHLPSRGNYGAGMLFLPRDPQVRLFCEGRFERVVREEGLNLLGWRDVPVDETACGQSGRASRPAIAQVFISRGDFSVNAFERKLLIVRKRVSREIAASGRNGVEPFYPCSLSSRTIVYKGQLLGGKIDQFYPELQNGRVCSAIAMVHERYSTNTFPQWKLAHPYRYLAHNGEINTIRGNVNWMNAREGAMHSELFGENFEKILPVVEPGGSDSSSLDNVFELFTANGVSPEATLMFLIPEAWQENILMNPHRRAFYEYHARMMEPWDGPAAILFSDGIIAGAVSDRNGLRPIRYILTDTDEIIMASEAGVTDIPPEHVIAKGILRPGTMIMADTAGKCIRTDDEIKKTAAEKENFIPWLEENRRSLDLFRELGVERIMHPHLLSVRKKIFGISQDEMEQELLPTAIAGDEPIGSMGIDSPLAILSKEPVLLFDYFRQSFAQVTNPPIDPIREKTVMSLTQYLGGYGERLDRIEIGLGKPFVELKSPLLSNGDMANLRNVDAEDIRVRVLPMTFQPDGGEGEIERALDILCERAERSARRGDTVLVLSDRNIGLYAAPIPSLLALGAVHQHLVRRKLRTKLDIIVESGDARNVMHLALLVGYGAKAVNPYMAFESLREAFENGKTPGEISLEGLDQGYIAALNSGLLKVLARMGISTLQSYHGAQIFEILGLDDAVTERCFTGTPSRLGGAGFAEITADVLERHDEAYKENGKGKNDGKRPGGNNFLFTPSLARMVRKACTAEDYGLFKKYTSEAEKKQKGFVLRSLLQFRPSSPIPLSEVEDEESILRRFTTGAVSVGSISPECHETLALAMNRLGGKSNSGEGGENPARNSGFKGKSTRSATRQIASGRFGVTLSYLVHGDELQIKMAQGAKPGEGGHLPGSKVSPEIAELRHTAPGTSLISPPPHHDIYSIEDLAQLIFDLRNVNPSARINVKLACRAGIGTIAAGVAKARADVISLCSHDGGTGAAPLSSMKYVGFPWEVGIAEAQQTLMLNDLRSRVVLQVEGRMMTGRDVLIAALLGAEEFGFTTAALAVCGCVLCRQCHRNRCSVGIATQDMELRTRFSGTTKDVETFFRFLVQEIRELMAGLGFRRFEDLVGRTDRLEIRSDLEDQERKINLKPLLMPPDLPERIGRRHNAFAPFSLKGTLDEELITAAEKWLTEGSYPSKTYSVDNTHRAIGAMLSGYLERKGVLPLCPSLEFSFTGTAGQSFGAFCAPGVLLRLEGAANDYLGKGLSGGILIASPHEKSPYSSSDNAIAGNTVLYGATSGEAYLCGMCGERFAVRNSGAIAVVEGVGNHGCEYMTGGVVVILGSTGRNFGAGMSGGTAYVLDDDGSLKERCHHASITVEKLAPEDDGMLLPILRNHEKYTRSAVAGELIRAWPSSRERFRKITPVAKPNWQV